MHDPFFQTLQEAIKCFAKDGVWISFAIVCLALLFTACGSLRKNGCRAAEESKINSLLKIGIDCCGPITDKCPYQI